MPHFRTWNDVTWSRNSKIRAKLRANNAIGTNAKTPVQKLARKAKTRNAIFDLVFVMDESG